MSEIGFHGPLFLHSWMENRFLGAFRAVILKVQLFTLLPGPKILKDVQQEATFVEMSNGIHWGCGGRTIVAGFIFTTREYYYLDMIPE